MPVCPSVADLDDEEAGDPWYISLFFFTTGVARVVPLDSLRHLEQTMASCLMISEEGVLRLMNFDGKGMLVMPATMGDG